MFTHIKTHFNSLPSIITAIFVGVFVSWVVAFAQLDVIPGRGGDPPPASVTATPSSGVAPLNGVDVAVSGGGSNGDTFIFKFNCVHGDGSIDFTYPSSGTTATNPYTAVDLCNYPSAGTYTVLADVTRYHTTGGSTSVTNFALTTNVTVSAPPPPAPTPPPPAPTPPPPAPSGWMNPTADPVDGNPPAPLNAGSGAQEKAGDLTVSNLFAGQLNATGDVSVSGTSNLIQSVTAGNLALNSSNAYANALLIPYGKVGIGTASPTANFDLRGTAHVIGDYSANLQFNEPYRSTTDGFVAAYLHADNDGDICTMIGSTHSKSVWRASADNRSGTRLPYDSILMPVRNFEIWQVDVNNVDGSCSYGITFIPIGEGGALLVNP